MSKLSLSELCKGMEPMVVPASCGHYPVTGISCNSKDIKEGYLFAALKGAQVDGSRFIPDAFQRGARIILCETQEVVPFTEESLCILRHPNPRYAFSLMASRFYHMQPGHIVAVTGTNGKTSCAEYCRQLWEALGKKSASIGTIGIKGKDIPDEIRAMGSLTTPDPAKLHYLLARMAEGGIAYLACEASSHGLTQYRLDGVRIQAAAFTNLSRDHLDYHQDMGSYFSAKTRLFSEVMEKGRMAVLNADIPEYPELVGICTVRGHTVISYGRKEGSTLCLREVKADRYGQRISFGYRGKQYTMQVALVGAFQAYNLLCALGLLLATGSNIDDVLQVVSSIRAAPGRMEYVAREGKGAAIYVDYAHTPDALQKALQELKVLTRGKLWVVFGCGGDRDRGKRPLMGEVAGQWADKVIITDDNPRGEVPYTIRKEILQSCRKGQEIGDRKEAIYYAVREAGVDDIILIAGKGHEKTQVVGEKTYPFDDCAVARAAVQDKDLGDRI